MFSGVVEYRHSRYRVNFTKGEVMNKGTIISVVVIGLIALVGMNQRTTKLVVVDQNNFCMYMDSYDSKGLGLLGCFKGNLNDEVIDEANDELTSHMMAWQPVIYVTKEES